MTLFFRQLRHRFINSSQFEKYGLYALGEIIILILGILIALKVDNWNHETQNRSTEIAILNSMKTELLTDLEEIKVNISIHDIGIRAAQIVIDHLENDSAYNDSLSIHFLDLSIYTHHSYKKGAYTTLESLGIGIISNQELRNEIIELYAFNEEMLRTQIINTDRVQHAENNLFNTRFDELGNIDFDLPHDLTYGRMIPLDYEALKEDEEFKFYAKTYRNSNIVYLKWWYIPLQLKVQNLISSIEKELLVLA